MSAIQSRSETYPDALATTGGTAVSHSLIRRAITAWNHQALTSAAESAATLNANAGFDTMRAGSALYIDMPDAIVTMPPMRAKGAVRLDRCEMDMPSNAHPASRRSSGSRMPISSTRPSRWLIPATGKAQAESRISALAGACDSHSHAAPRTASDPSDHPAVFRVVVSMNVRLHVRSSTMPSARRARMWRERAPSDTDSQRSDSISARRASRRWAGSPAVYTRVHQRVTSAAARGLMSD